jgi:DNA-binding IclR family transcriptional regulator
MGAAAGLHRHHAGRLAGEELEDALTSQPPAENDPARSIRPVRLEDMLRQIKTDGVSLRHGRLLLGVVSPTTPAQGPSGEASTP